MQDNQIKYFFWTIYAFIIFNCILGFCGIYKDDKMPYPYYYDEAELNF